MRKFIIGPALVGLFLVCPSVAAQGSEPAPQVSAMQTEPEELTNAGGERAPMAALDESVVDSSPEPETPGDAGDSEPSTTVERLEPGVVLAKDMAAMLADVKALGVGKVLEQNGRQYYAIEARAAKGEAYPTYYAVKGNRFAAQAIILRDALAEAPGCHPEAESCVRLRLVGADSEIAFNLKGDAQSYAYAAGGERESGYFAQARGAAPVSVAEMASDLHALGASRLPAWGPLPETWLPGLATADLSSLGLAIGQNGIKLDNLLGLPPRALEPTENGLMLQKAKKWKFGKIPATLSALNTRLDFDSEGGLQKAALSGYTQVSQDKADRTCTALSKTLGAPTATSVQKAGKVEIRSWWWLDWSLASLLRCTTVDYSRLGAASKTLVGYTLSRPEGSFAPVLAGRAGFAGGGAPEQTPPAPVDADGAAGALP